MGRLGIKESFFWIPELGVNSHQRLTWDVVSTDHLSLACGSEQVTSHVYIYTYINPDYVRLNANIRF